MGPFLFKIFSPLRLRGGGGHNSTTATLPIHQDLRVYESERGVCVRGWEEEKKLVLPFKAVLTLMVVCPRGLAAAGRACAEERLHLCLLLSLHYDVSHCLCDPMRGGKTDDGVLRFSPAFFPPRLKEYACVVLVTANLACPPQLDDGACSLGCFYLLFLSPLALFFSQCLLAAAS